MTFYLKLVEGRRSISVAAVLTYLEPLPGIVRRAARSTHLQLDPERKANNPVWMGKRKRRQKSPSALHTSSPIPSKQLKVDDYLRSKLPAVSKPKSKLQSLEAPPHSGSDRAPVIEGQDVSVSAANMLNGDPPPAWLDLLSYENCRGRPGAPTLESEGPPNSLTIDLVANQSLLTAQTVAAIFKLLEELNSKVESLNELINEFFSSQQNVPKVETLKDLRGSAITSTLRTTEQQLTAKLVTPNSKDLKDTTKLQRHELQAVPIPAPQAVLNSAQGSHVIQPRHKTSNRILQRNQIALLIQNNNMNLRRWNSWKAVAAALGDLLCCDSNKLELLKIEWLPSPDRLTRVLLTFRQPTIPSMLCKMRPFLSSFEIFPSRVFQDTTVNPLMNFSGRRKEWQEYPRDNLPIDCPGINKKARNKEFGSMVPNSTKGERVSVDPMEGTSKARLPLDHSAQLNEVMDSSIKDQAESHPNATPMNGDSLSCEQKDTSLNGLPFPSPPKLRQPEMPTQQNMSEISPRSILSTSPVRDSGANTVPSVN